MCLEDRFNSIAERVCDWPNEQDDLDDPSQEQLHWFIIFEDRDCWQGHKNRIKPSDEQESICDQVLHMARYNDTTEYNPPGKWQLVLHETRQH